jgi:hypothetical protein
MMEQTMERPNRRQRRAGAAQGITLPRDEHGQVYYPPEIVAEILNVTPRTLKRWRLEGKGPAYIRISPKRVIYAKAAIDEFCGARTYQHRADELARQSAV